jgi:hypothetical protein
MKPIKQASNAYTSNISDLLNNNETNNNTSKNVKIYKKQPAFMYPAMMFLCTNKGNQMKAPKK